MRAITVALVLALAACSSPGAPEPSPSPTAIPQALSPGAEWVLVAPASLPADVTITFDADQVSGQAPVNRYFGPFTAGEDGSLEFGALARTEMAGPPELMQAEEEYFALLDRVTAFDADEVQLTLRTGGEMLLSFAQPDSPAVFGRTLVGMRVKKARAAAEAEGYDFRIVSVDGESKPVTMDYNPQRLNATVVDGRVTEVTVG